MKVLWLSNIPSPYRVSFFNELGKHCQLTVLFEKEKSRYRDKSWLDFQFQNFKGVILKGIKNKGAKAFCPSVVKYLKKDVFDKIIISDFTSLTGMLAILHLRRKKIPYWLESDGGFAKNGKGVIERIKSFFIKGADLYLSTGKTNDEYFLKYGAEREKIKFYPFTSIYDKDVLQTPLTQQGKSEIKKELNLPQKKIILAVGQFIYRKGFDILLRTCANIKNTIIVFVGGVPTEEYRDIIDEYKIDNIFFEGFKGREEIKKYYQAADVFVLPTREDIWGLVINEAMAYGIPVISTNKCGAAIQLIEHGKNGYIFDIEKESLLRDFIVDIIESKKYNEFSLSALETAKKYTFEKMVEAHLKIFI